MIRRLLLFIGLMLLVRLASVSGRLAAQEPGGPVRVPMPTMGGKQFWADELFFHQWRIQRNAFDGHYRLLDPKDLRHAWGTYDQCLAALERIKRQERLPRMSGKAVIVLHGLVRSRSSMVALCQYLRHEGGYHVFNVGYPSTRDDIAEHARSLRHVIDNLDGVEEINFVAHSMGNIVVRHYLADQTSTKLPSGGPPSTIQRRPDKRIRRFVMLAPPNHGSLAALTLTENGVFKLLAGKSGQQLGGQWAKLEGKLGVPPCQFGIIAGGTGNDNGFNPLLPGDNDATITVASTRLAGARDFLRMPVLHSFVIIDPRIREYTLRFLQHGHFISRRDRQPITEDDH